MIYAHIDDKNKLLGWYDTEIHTTIPTPNVAVTQDAWQLAIDNGHNKINTDGTTEYFDFRTDNEIYISQQETINQTALAYLASTDWYVIRLQETGIAIPQSILDARANARQQVVPV